MVDSRVAKSVVAMIPQGFRLPSAARMLTTPLGSKARPEVLIAKNRHIALVATPLYLESLLSSCIALMPRGVAAFPSPSMFAEMFMIIAAMAGVLGRHLWEEARHDGANGPCQQTQQSALFSDLH